MPGKWIKRDPESGQIWQELDENEMAALIRRNNPDSPEYVKHVPEGATRVFLIDRHTVGVELVGTGPEDVPFRWEFDLYEGWYEGGHTVPSPSIVAGAKWLGMSLLDYLCAPGSATATAQRMVTAERSHALRVAEPLLVALRELNAVDADGCPKLTQRWYQDRFTPVREILLSVLARLTDGSVERADELLGAAFLDSRSVSDALPYLEERWHVVDHVQRGAQTA